MKKVNQKNNLTGSSIVLLMLLINLNPALSQNGHWQIAGNSNISTPAPDQITAASYIGTNNAVPFNLRTNLAQPMNFFTNSTQRMVITGTTGFVGIGNGFTSPNQMLTLDGGNINVQDFTIPLVQNNGYMIGNVMTMWRGSAGNITNIFVGATAGAANTIGTRNTFVGNNAGAANNQAPDNTFIGFNAGLNNTSTTLTNGRDNVFVGSMAGQANTIGRQNTFVGYQAGFRNVTVIPLNGEMNTFIGNTAGDSNTVGANNTFLGDQSGPNNVSGSSNVFLGRGAGGGNVSGDFNTLVGHGARLSGPGFTNAAAIGAQTIVTNNNMMILGNNRVFVGIGLSGITPGPQNCLEIVAHPYGLTTPTPNASGLRFRQLTSASPAGPVATKVLTVDINGDVVLAAASTGTGTVNGANNGTSLDPLNPSVVQLGNDVGATTAQLLNDREIPMNNNNITFSGDGLYQKNVFSIGNFTTIGKFNVSNNANYNAAFFFTDGSVIPSGNANGVSIEIQNSLGANNALNIISSTPDPSALSRGLNLNLNGTGFQNTGIETAVQGVASYQNQAVVGHAENAAQFNVGGSFRGGVVGGPAANSNYGMIVDAQGASNNNYGVFSTSQNAANNYGVYAIANGGSNCYGIYSQAGGGTNNYAGYFNGDVIRTGTDNFTSDQTLKQDINPLSNAMGIISQLLPKTFYFDTIAHANMKLSSKYQYGFIAQDVETILPELIGTAVQPAVLDSAHNIVIPSLTYKTLNYNAFIAILMKGMQEQQSKIDSLSEAMTQLNNNLNSCCYNHQAQASSTIPASGINVELKDAQSIVLDQNVPNPFAEQTTINYFLPETVVKAQILFYNAAGKLIQTVELKEKGKGQLNVFASDLSNGVYSYTLVADGNIIETKRMIKQ
ncbi:MAG: hypothetical protein JWO44_1434 [Bacteroidetes bacterium]|nr:hypothetical protein [Bacteroidota bacterium]